MYCIYLQTALHCEKELYVLYVLYISLVPVKSNIHTHLLIQLYLQNSYDSPRHVQ